MCIKGTLYRNPKGSNRPKGNLRTSIHNEKIAIAGIKLFTNSFSFRSKYSGKSDFEDE